MKMKFRIFGVAFSLLLALGACTSKYDYQTVDGDPLNTKIYTLDNGLKVYMSVNRDEPRIQTNIVVRVGSKNDPAETTGLAHYFEHLMFKGTKQFGTQDYAAEEPMLDKIEQLFEQYRVTTDEAERAAIYKQIDSIGYQASLIAIPNEYDKLMAAIGATALNAYTSYDLTCYHEDIPSNQIENWAKIESDRFENPILRGFHTELETIYEEKNMELTDDSRRMLNATLAALFPTHPYGTQSVLGSQEHLKNPSITNVKNYHKEWYVPNNMAICLSGDFDPDYMVDVITKYFGHLQPNENLKALEADFGEPITEPKRVEIYGQEAERIYLAWRTPAPTDEDKAVVSIITNLLSNGSCGLMDVNLNNNQKVLYAGVGVLPLADQGAFLMIGMPNAGQTLNEVRDLMLQQLEQLRKGEFDSTLLPAIVNNYKLGLQQSFESNSSRADYFVNAFANGQEWADVVAEFDNIGKVTKEDVVRVANKYFGSNNYAAIYKLRGEDKSVVKMPKPALTPIATNRDVSSAFLEEVANSHVEPIEPVFVDFEKDITILNTKNGIPVYYTKNTTNGISSLIYNIEIGSDDNKLLAQVDDYFDLLGTEEMTADELKREFYNLACSYALSVGGDRTYMVINGLSENLPKAAALFENFMQNAKIDVEAWQRLVGQIAQSRYNNKQSQEANFAVLGTYIQYGPKNPQTSVSSLEELIALDPNEIINAARSLYDYEQEALYYGSLGEKEIIELIETTHLTPEILKPVPAEPAFKKVVPQETTIFIVPYESKQLKMRMFANQGGAYDIAKAPVIRLYNEYFGGSMNSIVFQEMRESRSLAYSSMAYQLSPSDLHHTYTYVAQISTQNDKMKDAIDAFLLIINDMPCSEASFELAKQSIEANIRSQRVIKSDIAWAYLNAKQLGLKREARQDVYEILPTLTFDDVLKYQQEKVKGLTYNYGILGKVEDLDMDVLNKLGKVVILKPEDVFGY